MRRRTPFVWLPDQPIRHSAGFATLRGAPLRREDEGTNRWVLARGRFRLDPDGGPAALAITADGRYRAWIDGGPLGRGPVRAAPAFLRVDTYPLADCAGQCVLAVLVHVPGVDLAWYETMKGAWQPVFGDGGLYCEAVQGSQRVPIEWRIEESCAWRRDTAREGWGQDFIEDFDARALDPRWIEPKFDDSGWREARAMVSLGSPDEKARGFGRVEPFPALMPRGIPHAVTGEVLPSRVLWARLVEPRPDLPLEARLYCETLGEDAAAYVLNADALLRSGDADMVVRTPCDRDVALMLSFDPLQAGYPFIELEAQGGEVIEVAVAEAVPGEFGRGTQGDPLRPEGHLGVSHVVRYTARPGRQRFEKFNWAAVRAMQVVVRNAPEGLTIRRIGSVATHYPVAVEGGFECSDPLLNRLWAVGRHTVLQCVHDAWVDCPGREARQWVGDAVVQFDVAARAFGTSVYPLQAQFLRHAAESQRQDGLVRMFAPGDLAADALVIPDFSLLWMIAAERYYKQAADLETIEAILPAIERALAWFDRHCGEHGLLVDVPEWHFIEWANLGRSGESAAVNALYAGALASVAVLARAAQRGRLAERCFEKSRLVAAALNASHWDPQRGVYVDSVDPDSAAQGRRVSQHANALMLLFGFATEERQAALLKAITVPARLKLTAAPPIVPEGPPFDEDADIVRANTFFSHFVYDALAGSGAFAWVLDDIRSLYGPMLASGTTTLWESFSPAASLCHGFSATPVYQLSCHALGVAPLTPGHATFMLSPRSGGLSWARGKVPTPHGTIEVEWRARDGLLHVEVAHPAGCRLVILESDERGPVSHTARKGGATLIFEDC